MMSQRVFKFLMIFKFSNSGSLQDKTWFVLPIKLV